MGIVAEVADKEKFENAEYFRFAKCGTFCE